MIYRPSQLLFGCAKGIASDMQRTCYTQDLFSELTIVVDGLLVSTRKLRCGKVLQLLGGSSQLHPLKTKMIQQEIHLQMVPFSIAPPSKGLQHDTGGFLLTIFFNVQDS